MLLYKISLLKNKTLSNNKHKSCVLELVVKAPAGNARHREHLKQSLSATRHCNVVVDVFEQTNKANDVIAFYVASKVIKLLNKGSNFDPCLRRAQAHVRKDFDANVALIVRGEENYLNHGGVGEEVVLPFLYGNCHASSSDVIFEEGTVFSCTIQFNQNLLKKRKCRILAHVLGFVADILLPAQLVQFLEKTVLLAFIVFDVLFL